MNDIREMKMVVRCRSAEQYSDYVLREYLVYRIYNLISPYSFRTRLVRLRFIDTGRKNKMTENWAFLIEPNDLMAAYIGEFFFRASREKFIEREIAITCR